MTYYKIQMPNYTIKITLLGEAAVGKTSLIYKFVHNKFKKSYALTVGMDISTKIVEFAPGEIAKLAIWDIGGQQRFESLRTAFYSGTLGALLVFDLTRESTFARVKNWLAEIREFIGRDIPFVLIGNKLDLLEDVGEVVDREEARTFAESMNSIYIETSARTGLNVEWGFTELIRLIMNSKK